MTTNKEAYDVIREGLVAAMTGFQDAKTIAASEHFMSLYQELDDELDAMIAARIEKGTSQYSNLTKGINSAKERMQKVQDDATRFIRSANRAAKIIGIFTKVLALI